MNFVLMLTLCPWNEDSNEIKIKLGPKIIIVRVVEMTGKIANFVADFRIRG